MMREQSTDPHASPPHDQQEVETRTAQQPSRQATASSVGKFIVDDLKLFVSPVRAVINEFRRQVKL